MKIVNLSYYISEKTPCFAGAKNITFEASKSIKCGHTSNSFFIKFHNHVGTHIDLPLHFDQQGKSLSDYQLQDFIFKKPFVIELMVNPNHLITASDLKNFTIPSDTDLLLIKTNFSKNRDTEDYWRNNPGVDANTADYLRENFPLCRCLGFDFISLTAFQEREAGRVAHVNFLGKGDQSIWIIEDMNLTELDQITLSQVLVSPLLIEGADGTPVTVWGFTS